MSGNKGRRFTAEHRRRLSEAMKRARAKWTPDQTRDAVRFWSRVDRRGPDECWLWTGARNARGYGVFGLRNKKVLASRFALWGGHGPAGRVAMHRCDNPPCCNPAHLIDATQDANMLDATAKGRMARGEQSGAWTKPEKRRRGEDHGNSKLTAEDVRDIRRRAADGERIKVIADTHRMSAAHIRAIVKREAWSHVE